ncbi:MAG: hypothetical protein VXW87_02485 [Pseudomonadota bacterium]|nr:hypothetical protein [Pseudomonadota bacterium]
MPYDSPLPIITDASFHIANFGLTIFVLLFSTVTIVAIYLEHKSPRSWYQVADDEYNFMASEESEQSRLDLAEAYLDIGQVSDATIILKGLLLSKNPITKQRSKQLLNQHPS